MYQVYQVVYNSSEDGRGPCTKSALFATFQDAEATKSRLDPYYRSGATIDTLNVWESLEDNDKEKLQAILKRLSKDELTLVLCAYNKGEL